MSEDDTRKRMLEVLDLVASDIASIRTGRATPAIVQDLKVAVYDGQQKLKINELATITSEDAKSIVIDPWDKSVIGEIRNGILKANIGLNPTIDGEIIRISLPPLTTEDRERFVKLLSKKAEQGRIMIRQIRGEGIKNIKDAFEKKEVTEDEKFNQEKSLQELTDEHVSKIDELGEVKKGELLQI
ncbi:ribosome recycling factor [Patescibacteria group bacterium]|nr:ribosome recycling factor [Patescibacteria group bacterium]